MGFYRKKPVVIEAFQITMETRKDNKDWPNWLSLAWQKGHSEVGALYPVDFPNSNGNDELEIMTLEGVFRVSFDDFIIKGIEGELYSCKPDIFNKTYEKV